MDDVQLPAEETAVVETPQEQTPVETPQTEDVQTEVREPDLRVPLQEERRRRQEYERQLSDPQFIFQKAVELGLADADAQPELPQAATPQVAPTDIAQLVELQLDFRETIAKYPDLNPNGGDPALSAWAASLVDKGHKPSEAADIIYKAINSRISKAKSEGAKEKEAAILEKELATSVTSSSNTTSEASEMENLKAQTKNWKNPKAQEQAILELFKKNIR